MAKNTQPPIAAHGQLYMINEGDKIAFYERTAEMKFDRIGEAALGSTRTAKLYDAARKKKLRFFL